MGEPWPTPSQTIGPFFHHAMEFPGARELVPPGSASAVHLHGAVYDGAGQPVTDAMVEIRQAGPDGALSRRTGSIGRDAGGFTGWGRALTRADGSFSFVTVEPAAAKAGSAAFYSVLVFARGVVQALFTRAYVPGPELDRDPLLSTLDPAQRETLLARRETDGSLRFDIHLQGEHETVFFIFPDHQA